MPEQPMRRKIVYIHALFSHVWTSVVLGLDAAFSEVVWVNDEMRTSTAVLA